MGKNIIEQGMDASANLIEKGMDVSANLVEKGMDAVANTIESTLDFFTGNNKSEEPEEVTVTKNDDGSTTVHIPKGK